MACLLSHLLRRVAPFSGAALLAMTQPAAAQWTVFDPTNYTQNVLGAARALQQINNQIQALQNQATMLRTMDLNLARSEFPDLAGLTTRIAEVSALIQQAQGVAFRIGEVDRQFRALFPDFDPASSAGASAAQAKVRLDTVMAGLRQTMKVQADVAGNIEADAATLATLSGRSQSAVGALQAAQATNQLLALATKQQFQIQHLLAAQFRAEATGQARTAQAERDAEAAARKFLGAGTAYTPR